MREISRRDNHSVPYCPVSTLAAGSCLHAVHTTRALVLLPLCTHYIVRGVKTRHFVSFVKRLLLLVLEMSNFLIDYVVTHIVDM